MYLSCLFALLSQRLLFSVYLLHLVAHTVGSTAPRASGERHRPAWPSRATSRVPASATDVDFGRLTHFCRSATSARFGSSGHKQRPPARLLPRWSPLRWSTDTRVSVPHCDRPPRTRQRREDREGARIARV